MEERLPVGKIAKNSLKDCVFFLLIRHSKYSAILSNGFFGDFSHWLSRQIFPTSSHDWA